MNTAQVTKILPFTVDEPNLPNLQRIHLHLVTHIPYENLSVYHDTPFGITTTWNPLFKKLSSSRGGFCLELNTLYYEILTSFGYQVRKGSSCVLLSWDGTPRLDTHQTLIVTIDQDEYLCDIGASEFTPLEPVLISKSEEPWSVESALQGIPPPTSTCFQKVKSSGGTLGRLSLASFEGRETLCYEILQQQKKETHFIPFFIVRMDTEVDDAYFEDMCRRLATPATCPPRPYFTEFATLPQTNGSRRTLIGSAGNGYTFLERDANGAEIRKLKLAPHFDTKPLLWSEFGIKI
jgi:N-hydroxyarylamine O-acetyltransferase